MVLLTRASIAHDVLAKRQALEIQAFAYGTRACHELLMSRAFHGIKTIGPFNPTEIGHFFPTLERSFSPDPNNVLQNGVSLPYSDTITKVVNSYHL